MADQLPQGYQAAAVYSGVKRNPNKFDLSLIVSQRPAVAVGMFTQNIVHGAPIRYNRERLPSESIRAVVINSGVANACTGEQGYRDAIAMAEKTAHVCGCKPEEVLVLSTGLIGEMLPMEKITAGIEQAAQQLGDSPELLVAAARGMMTTDTCHKIRCREVDIDGTTYRVTGLAKGAAMIGPKMATMLAVVTTDAPLRCDDARAALQDAVDESFNCISVEGHMSTSDSVLLLANGAAGGEPLAGDALLRFRSVLVEICEDLAQSIPADGEGATHLITVEVHGAASRGDAVAIARTVADSPLVKTAVAGADPNWGRIVSAAGYAGVSFDPDRVSLHVNDSLLYERGVPSQFDAQAVSLSMRERRDTHIVLLLEEGEASARFWSSDLTAEYVRLNADYHT